MCAYLNVSRHSVCCLHGNLLETHIDTAMHESDSTGYFQGKVSSKQSSRTQQKTAAKPPGIMLVHCCCCYCCRGPPVISPLFFFLDFISSSSFLLSLFPSLLSILFLFVFILSSFHPFPSFLPLPPSLSFSFLPLPLPPHLFSSSSPSRLLFFLYLTALSPTFSRLFSLPFLFSIRVSSSSLFYAFRHPASLRLASHFPLR